MFCLKMISYISSRQILENTINLKNLYRHYRGEIIKIILEVHKKANMTRILENKLKKNRM